MGLNKEFIKQQANVEYGGKYARYSYVIEGLISDFMDIATYQSWLQQQFVKNNSSFPPIDKTNTMGLDDAVFRMRTYHVGNWTQELLVECGIAQNVATLMCSNIYNKHHPKQIDGYYICPKCGQITEEMMAECHNPKCGMAFAW